MSCCCRHRSMSDSQNITANIVVYLPPSGNKCPGLELVAVSRAVALNDFAIGNTETELTRQTLSRIGNTNAYKARKEFLHQTRARSEPSQEFTKLAITALDPAVDRDKTFEGGHCLPGFLRAHFT
eukprot:scaffold15374_cov35-Cyclotella_meneghiniana.AAC.2